MGTSDRMQRTGVFMQNLLTGLIRVMPGCTIVLLVVPPGGNRANYISNGKHEEMATLMKEVVARWEGRAHDAPATRQ